MYHSLMKTGTAYPFVVLILENSQRLGEVMDKNKIDYLEYPQIMPESEYLSKNTFSNWNETFFKINIFRLTQFEKIVYLDADMIVRKNIDELFAKPHMSCVAAGDCAGLNWKLNTGLMVIEPNESLFNELYQMVPSLIEERVKNNQGFGDQDLINKYFSEWDDMKELHLSEKYNAMTRYLDAVCKLPEIKSFDDIAVIHYIGMPKPWRYGFKDRAKLFIKCILRSDLSDLKAYKIFLHYMKEVEDGKCNNTNI